MASRRAFLRAGAGAVALSTTPRAVDAAGRQPAPTTDWTATYEPGEGRALPAALDADGAGGYWLAGTRFADGESQGVWLVPVSGDGTAGAPTTTDRYDRPFVADLARAGDGGCLVTGSVYRQGPWAVRYDPDGTERWHADLSAEELGSHTVGAVVPNGAGDDGDGHLLVGTRLGADSGRPATGWVGRLGADGTLASAATVEGPGDRLALRDATPTGDGDVFAVGRAVGDDEAAWLGVLSPDGGVRWGRTLADLDGLEVIGATACASLSDGYVLGAYGGSTIGEDQPYVVAVGPEGEVRWRVLAPGPGAPGAVVPTDRGVFAVGDSPLQTTQVQSWATWATAGGERLWRATYRDDRPAVDAVEDGDGVAVAGRSGAGAQVRRLSLPAQSGGNTTTVADGGADSTDDDGTNEDGETTDGETNDDGETPGTDGDGLALPGLGVETAVAAGALGLAELFRRRERK